MKMMNERAKSLGATNTNFTNAHGYHDPKLYTTASDLAKIGKEAAKHPIFLKVAGTPSYYASYKGSDGDRKQRLGRIRINY